MLSGSIGNQCQVVSLEEAIGGDPGGGELTGTIISLMQKTKTSQFLLV